MSLLTCVDCSTRYSVDLGACPHCGSSTYEESGVAVKRLPLFVTVRCTSCMRGPWTVRMESRTSGLIELPTLACASCGCRVPVTWPPEEEPMSPKITVHGGATNARDADVSPAADASQPPVAAEGDGGRPTPEEPEVVEAAPEPVEEVVEEPAEVTEPELVDYDGMTLAELREAAAAADLPVYGTKAQLVERLKGADEPNEE